MGSTISHFYRFDCDMQHNELTVVVPDGTLDIIFECDKEKPSAFIYGTVLKGRTQCFKMGKTYFGVRFLPGVLSHFFNVSVKELINSELPLYEIKKAESIIERIAKAEEFETQIAIFIEEFECMIDIKEVSQQYTLVTQLLNEIYKTNGNVQIQELEKRVNYSRRHINRVFEEYTGVSIKHFCKYMRFQGVLEILKKGQYEHLVEVATTCGYYDQTHFLKDFKEYAMLSPSLYKKQMIGNAYQKKIIEV